MKFVYPAIIREEENGFRGWFPDLDGCDSTGSTFDEVYRQLKEAEYNWIMLELEEEDPVLPAVSHLQDLELKEGEFARNISVKVRLTEGWEE